MITIKNISKKYHNKTVLANISTEFPENSLISIIGPNGAGKSTLLSIMSRLIFPDNGEVIIDNKSISDWDTTELSKTISILKQSNFTNLKLTIYELVSFGRFPYCGGRLTDVDRKHIDDAIEYMKLSDISHKYLDQLSGGQVQRAYIAMTIAQNTKYIFLDEPLNNLDMKHSVAMMKTLRTLCADLSKTIIVVLHDINFASVYSDYILALKDGELFNMDKTEAIIVGHTLSELYNMDINIKNVNNKNICIYF